MQLGNCSGRKPVSFMVHGCNILEVPIDLAGSVAELAGVFVGRAVRPADWGGRLTLAAAAPVN